MGFWYLVAYGMQAAGVITIFGEFFSSLGF